MSFTNHDAINFKDVSPQELTYIFYVRLGKRATKENMAILKLISDDYKYHRGVTTVTHCQDFYDYAKSHAYYNILSEFRH